MQEKNNLLSSCLTSPLAGGPRRTGKRAGEGARGNTLLNPLIGFECLRTQNHFPREGGSHTTNGFTLIELLVVVLIIGILAAVALPQYNKAVEKSRFMTLLGMAKAVAEAQETYYLANGSYASDVEELPINLPAGSTTSDNYTVFGNGTSFKNYGHYIVCSTKHVQLEWWLEHSSKDSGPYCLADPTNLVAISVCKSIGTFTRHTSCGAIHASNCDEYKIKL